MAVRRFEGPTAQLMRTKTDLGTPDPDVADPTVSLASLPTDYVWALDGRRRGIAGSGEPLNKLLITVTYRNAATGAEVAGTYDCYAFAILPHGTSGESAPAHRPKVQKLGSETAQPTAEPMVVDVGRHERFGIRLNPTSYGGATEAYITVEEWG